MLVQRRITSLIGVTLLGLALLPPAAAFGQDFATPTEFELEYAGSALWSRFGDNAVHGTHVYFAAYANLLVYDLSDPLIPRLESTLHLEFDHVYDMEVVEDYLYITTTGASADSSVVNPIYIVDIRDPAAPQAAGTFPNGMKGQSMCESGGYLYMGYRDTIHILNVTAPTEPE